MDDKDVNGRLFHKKKIANVHSIRKTILKKELPLDYFPNRVLYSIRFDSHKKNHIQILNNKTSTTTKLRSIIYK